MNYKKILVIFKTHLDVGFTDYSENVIRKYFGKLMPSALEIGNGEIGKSKNGFVWTTGSWLIYEFLKRADDEQKKALESAVENGTISWHALPFTTHTECMDKKLFEYGIALSEELDAIFGKKTIAAKMTDVPGHTKAMLPILAKHGVEFLHIGVNPACALPEVPSLFRWQDEDKNEIVVMYDKDYGKFTPIGNSGTWVYFAHTGDNIGAPAPEEVSKIFAQLERDYPEAEIKAACLNDVAEAIRPIKNTLPVVNEEIGDTWIHGLSSDPQKMKKYRGLLRFAETLPTEKKEKMLYELLMIPEHTWGMDVKTHLYEHNFFKTEELGWLRNMDTLPVGAREWEDNRDLMMASMKVKHIEHSWQEQRQYLENALNTLNATDRKKAEAYLKSEIKEFTAVEKAEKLEACKIHKIGDWEIRVDFTGTVTWLKNANKVFCSEENPGGVLIYEALGSEDYDRKYLQYNAEREQSKQTWAIEDFHKFGIENACVSKRVYNPVLDELYLKGNAVIAKVKFGDEATTEYGCPKEWEIRYDLSDGKQVNIDVIWAEKQATRVTEAIWFGFFPKGNTCFVQKLGEWVNCSEVVERGGRNIWGTDYGFKTEDLLLESPDCSLISCGTDTLLNFDRRKAHPARGLFASLYTNIWASNFPLWNDEDASFRFVLK